MGVVKQGGGGEMKQKEARERPLIQGLFQNNLAVNWDERGPFYCNFVGHSFVLPLLFSSHLLSAGVPQKPSSHWILSSKSSSTPMALSSYVCLNSELTSLAFSYSFNWTNINWASFMYKALVYVLGFTNEQTQVLTLMEMTLWDRRVLRKSIKVRSK